MLVLMTTLSKAKNGDWFARKGIPADVRDAYQRAYGVRQEERFRLTKEKSSSSAKIAFAEWVAEIERRIDSLRSAARGDSSDLTHRQIHVLVGRWYDWFVAQYEENPLSSDAWDDIFDRYQDVKEAFGGLGEGDDTEEISPKHRALVRAKVVEISRLPTFLAMEGTSVSSDNHAALVDALESDMVAALALLRRRAGGDYTQDRHREKFPEARSHGAGTKLSGWNVWDAFEAWVKERKPASSTINRWRGVFLDLNKFLDQRDVALVTGEEAVAWKDRLVAGGAGGRTINEVWLTSAHRIFSWVQSQKKISVNPFEGVKVAVARTGPTKGEFTEDDALVILTATLKTSHVNTSTYQAAARRWVPWLCAYTGSRSGEMTQLRREDIQQHKQGFWTLRITPEAGTVKGSKVRTVVLHEHLIEQGFIDFVQKAKPGPLFYDPVAAKAQVTEDPLNPPRPLYVQARQKLAAWVRKLGVNDPGVGPNHGWRHTFKRRAARAKIEERIRYAFCGHTKNDVGAIYELPSVEDLAEAIKDFPRYPVNTPVVRKANA